MGKYSGICDIKSITNAQDYNFWADEKLYAAKDNADATGFDERKKIMKYRGFKIVSDQTGNIFNPDVLLWFGPDDLQATKSRFAVGRSGAFPQVDGKRKYPIQIIWAGKPYPLDYPAISTFNRLVEESKKYKIWPCSRDMKST